MKLLIHYNTALPSNVAVERLFSIGKDFLKPKRCGLSDNQYEMLSFMGRQLTVITAAFIVSALYTSIV